MLCEIEATGNFFITWLVLSALGFISIMASSGTVFYWLYANPTEAMWKRKINPSYPPPEKVRDEVLEMLKGMFTASLCPTISLYLSRNGWSQGYCGVEPHGWSYLAFSTLVMWLGSDFVEWGYHYLGHSRDWFWNIHKPHHAFWNPTVMAVISDEPFDQFCRAAPLLVFPLLFPTNMDVMFGMYVVFFYFYGIFLHSGHELSWPDAHHPVLNTSFQHYLHHAKSSRGTPYHTGFFFKLWDQMAGSVWKKDCFCIKCQVAKDGPRTHKQWLAVKDTLPDYGVLTQPSFWLTPPAVKAA